MSPPADYLAFRRELILQGIDVATARGLEIGPLNNPVVRRADGPVRYVDFTDTETLRAKPYDASINPADILDVDIVWGGRRLREAAGGPVDYVIAAHVLEHVPDLIGWLQEMAEALTPDGVLSLVVPDKRYTFDLRRHTSTLAEAAEAYLLKYRQPSIRQMFDNCFQGVVVDKAEAWTRDLTDAPLPKIVAEPHALPLAWAQAQRLAAAPEYIDSHCWIFTPGSFLDLLDEIAQLGLLPFVVTGFTPTMRNEFEFFARLAPTDPADVDAVRASIAAHRPEPESPPDAVDAGGAADPTPVPSLPRRAVGKLKRMLIGG